MNDPRLGVFTAEPVVRARRVSPDEVLVFLRYAPAGRDRVTDALVVQRVARHWRVCLARQGPALEDHHGYPDEGAAVEAARRILRARDAARRLRGDGTMWSWSTLGGASAEGDE